MNLFGDRLHVPNKIPARRHIRRELLLSSIPLVPCVFARGRRLAFQSGRAAHALLRTAQDTHARGAGALAYCVPARFPALPVPILGGEATEVGACIGLQPDDSFSSSQPKLATPRHSRHAAGRTSSPSCSMVRSSPPPLPADRNRQSVRVVPQPLPSPDNSTSPPASPSPIAILASPTWWSHLADDGLAALGFWHEAASLASRHRLPIVFMVENCAQSHPSGTGTVQSDDDLRDRAEAYGFPGITVDGNDIVAVWRVTQESIHRARSGAGPTLIECRTWRWHAEADAPAANGRALEDPPRARPAPPHGALHEEAQLVEAGVERQPRRGIPWPRSPKRALSLDSAQLALISLERAPNRRERRNSQSRSAILRPLTFQSFSSENGHTPRHARSLVNSRPRITSRSQPSFTPPSRCASACRISGSPCSWWCP